LPEISGSGSVTVVVEVTESTTTYGQVGGYLIGEMGMAEFKKLKKKRLIEINNHKFLLWGSLLK